MKGGSYRAISTSGRRESVAQNDLLLQVASAAGADGACDRVRGVQWVVFVGPWPTLCNRAFAHYGTSFGHVGMEFMGPRPAVQQHLRAAHADGKTAKLYYFDRASWTLEV